MTTIFGLKTQLKAPKLQLPWLRGFTLLSFAVQSVLYALCYDARGRGGFAVSELKMQRGDSFLTVLTIGHHEALYFEGSVHNLRSIEAAFEQLVDRYEDATPTLLIKASADLKMELFCIYASLLKMLVLFK